jgi:hypothetical protein
MRVVLYTTTHPKISTLTTFKTVIHDIFACPLIASVEQFLAAPEFRRNKQWMTHDRWRDVMQKLPATSSVLHSYDVAPHSCIVNSSPNSGAPETAQQWGLSPDRNGVQIIYFYRTADRHPRSCDISVMHFGIFFGKPPIRVWLIVSETSFPRKRIPWAHFAWLWKGFTYFLANVCACLMDQCM